MASAPISAAALSGHGGGSCGMKMYSSAPPIAKLIKPQITLRTAEDSPTPRGEANGV
jgi:hypothetical protein